jgi:hypothetical protein
MKLNTHKIGSNVESYYVYLQWKDTKGGGDSVLVEGDVPIVTND